MLLPSLESKASSVLRFLVENEVDFYDPSFARQLSALRIVPTQVPPGWSQEASLLSDFSGSGGGGGGNSGQIGNSSSGGGGGSSSTLALVRFSDACVPKDRHLVWTSVPVLPAHLAPPQMMWSSLGLQTPPPLPVVLTHLKTLLSRGNALLDRWPPEALDPPQVLYT